MFIWGGKTSKVLLSVVDISLQMIWAGLDLSTLMGASFEFTNSKIRYSYECNFWIYLLTIYLGTLFYLR
jgi:hypothetical protein